MIKNYIKLSRVGEFVLFAMPAIIALLGQILRAVLFHFLGDSIDFMGPYGLELVIAALFCLFLSTSHFMRLYNLSVKMGISRKRTLASLLMLELLISCVMFIYSFGLYKLSLFIDSTFWLNASSNVNIFDMTTIYPTWLYPVLIIVPPLFGLIYCAIIQRFGQMGVSVFIFACIILPNLYISNILPNRELILLSLKILPIIFLAFTVWSLYELRKSSIKF